MGNVSGRETLRLANTIFGIDPRTGLLNLLFEILDGELIVETVDGDSGVDLTDTERLRLVMGVVVFGNTGAKLQQVLGDVDDFDAVKTRFGDLLEGLPGDVVVEREIGAAVNGHPVLSVAAVFTFEQGQDGATAYRLYRNPALERGAAIGYLQTVRKEFAAKQAVRQPEDPGANGKN